MIRSEICHNCNYYKDTCSGDRFETTEDKPNECIHSFRTPDNTKSDIQVAACLSLFNTKVKCGIDKLTAFVEAIVQTSDDAFAEAKAKRGHLVKRHNDRPRNTRGRKANKL